jgi:hypothetical protein
MRRSSFRISSEERLDAAPTAARHARGGWPIVRPIELLLLLLAGCAGALAADEIVPGVAYWELERPGPVRVFVLRVERARPELDLTVGWPDGRRGYTQRAATSAIAAHYDASPELRVVGGVNASFFGPIPVVVGLTISEGEPLQPPSGSHDTFVVRDDGTAAIFEDVQALPGTLTVSEGPTFVIDAYDRLPADDQITAYTASWGALTFLDGMDNVAVCTLGDVQGAVELGTEWQATVRRFRGTDGEAIAARAPDGIALVATGAQAAALRQHLSPGDRVRGRIGQTKPALADVDVALTGLGWLVRKGRPHTENWQQYGFFDDRHPRTVFAWNRAHWFLVAIDGRSKKSVGMDFAEMAALLIEELHVEEALNLDGGGSTTMLVDGRVRNEPSDGHERAVGNALLVVQRSAAAATQPAK